MTERRFGAQSMTAICATSSSRGPGRAFGRAFEDPAHGFLRPVDLDRPDASTTGSSRRSIGSARRCSPRRRDGRPGPRLHVRPAPRERTQARSRFGPASRTGRRAGGARGVDDLRGHPDGRADRRPQAPSRAATRSGCGPTCCASAGRSNERGGCPAAGGHRRGRRADVRPAVLAGSSGAGPPAVGRVTGRRRPRGRLPAAPAGWAVERLRARDPAHRGPGGRVPDPGLQRPRGPTGRRDRR